MKANLKLVSNNARPTLTRPIRTEYNSPGYGGVGHSRTDVGALKAALPRVMSGEFSGAVIYDAFGNARYKITRRGESTSVRKYF